MAPVQHLAILNLAAMALTLLAAGLFVLWHPKNRQAQGIITVVCLTFTGSLTIDVVLTLLCRIIDIRYDQYLYRIDALFGEPSYIAGRLLEHHAWLRDASVWAYDLPITAFLILTVAYYMTLPSESVREMTRTMIICLIPAPLEYLLLPVSGPVYAFSGFPEVLPVIRTPHILTLAAPPNGVPSIHMVFALLLWYFARRWILGNLLGAIFTLFTVFATLGLGEHYFLDLLAAVPHTALSIYLGASAKPLSLRTIDPIAPEMISIAEGR